MCALSASYGVAVPVLARALALLLLHHEGEVRRVAGAAAAAACVKDQPAALMLPLMDGMRHWMNQPDAATVLVVSRGVAWLGGGGGQAGEVPGESLVERKRRQCSMLSHAMQLDWP
jgi:hypothetical protein